MTTTYTSQEVLLRLADEVGETHTSYLDSAVGNTYRAAGVSMGAEVNFQYAYAYVEGKGVRTITSYLEADEQFVTSSAFSPAAIAGELVTVAWWDPHKRAMAQRAINQAIRASYPWFFREYIIDLNNNDAVYDGPLYSMVLYADGTHVLQDLDGSTFEYALPTDCAFLSRIGVQSDASCAVQWFAPMNIWRVVGGEGAFKVRFNDKVDFVRANAGLPLCLHYEAREPVFSAFTGVETTQLPLDYFSVAAEIYQRRMLGGKDAANKEAVLTEQGLAQEAMKAIQRMDFTKKSLPRGPKYSW